MPTFKVGDKVVRIKYFKPQVPQGVVFVVSEVKTYGSNVPADWDIKLEGVNGVWSCDYFALATSEQVATYEFPSAPGAAKVSGQFAVGDVVIRTGQNSSLAPWMKKGGQYTIAAISSSGYLRMEEDPEDVLSERLPWIGQYFEHVSLMGPVPQEQATKFQIGDKVVCVSSLYENNDDNSPAYFQQGQTGTITNMASQGTIICIDGSVWWRDASEFQLATGNEKPVVKPRYVVYNSVTL